MNRLVVVLCAACLVMLAWMVAVPRDSRGARPADLKGLRIGEPHRYGNLAVFPVISDVPRTADRFITLDEGLQAGTVEVYEVGADGNRVAAHAIPNPVPVNPPAAVLDSVEQVEQPGVEQPGVEQPGVEQPGIEQEQGQQIASQSPPPDGSAIPDPWVQTGAAPEVNRLLVVNRSGKPLYLMPGEVIVGGQQDRTIAEETILASTGQPVPIDVFCVEHGRWSGRQEQEAAEILAVVSDGSDAAAGSDARLSAAVRAANSGKFVASAGVLSKASRLATQAAKDQSDVWDAVSQSNAAAGLTPASGAFTANYVDPGNRQRLARYINQLQHRVTGEPNVVGVVVAINGKVEAVDVFESTPLFQKLWPKLLKSYALDASVADGQPPRRPPHVAAARDFLAKALSAEVKQESQGQGGLVVQERAADGVISFTANEPSFAGSGGTDAAAPAAGFGGFGGNVHTSALAH